MKYLLDTNAISELVARRPNKDVLIWLDALDPDDVYLSVITIGEIRKGVEKLPESSRKDSLRTWLNEDLLDRFSDRILVIDIDVMLHWGVLTGRLEQAGVPLPAMDSMVAALALIHQCTLVTRTIEHFKDTGVTLINPWTSGTT